MSKLIVNRAEGYSITVYLLRGIIIQSTSKQEESRPTKVPCVNIKVLKYT